ncbi:MAG: hypothetical protein ACE5R6_10600 [Candidatus Heimdallarchaeota archaeon]
MNEKDSPQPKSNDEEGTIEEYSSDLDELPDTVYVPLGRRGMESVPLKICSDCSKENLTLIQKKITRTAAKQGIPRKDMSLAEREIVDYKVRCQECGNQFIIRLTRLYFKEEPVQTIVSIQSKVGKPELWLGTLPL